MKHLLYDWGDLNVWLFQVINGHRSHDIDTVMVLAGYVADFWSFPFYAGAWGLALVLLTRRRADTAAARLQMQRFVLGFGTAVVAATMLKYGLDFPRPVTVLGAGAVHVLGDFDPRHSLPSGHATFAIVLAASLWPLLASGGKFAAVVFVAWTGIARVWTGAHFPADVLAAYLLGLLCAGFAASVIRQPLELRRLSTRHTARDSRS